MGYGFTPFFGFTTMQEKVYTIEIKQLRNDMSPFRHSNYVPDVLVEAKQCHINST
jgi:hypothetical protein